MDGDASAGEGSVAPAVDDVAPASGTAGGDATSSPPPVDGTSISFSSDGVPEEAEAAVASPKTSFLVLSAVAPYKFTIFFNNLGTPEKQGTWSC
ncbi:hypothetical protein Dimus_038871 [Dionaea muscipula]